MSQSPAFTPRSECINLAGAAGTTFEGIWQGSFPNETGKIILSCGTVCQGCPKKGKRRRLYCWLLLSSSVVTTTNSLQPSIYYLAHRCLLSLLASEGLTLSAQSIVDLVSALPTNSNSHAASPTTESSPSRTSFIRTHVL